MTGRLLPQCAVCAHYRSPLNDEQATDQTCEAYLAGIPDDIWWNRADHREPYAGDGGLRWAPLGAAVFPESALEMEADSG